MEDNTITIRQLVEARDALAVQEKKLYIQAAERMNMGMKEILKNDFGTVLVKDIGRDLAGEVSRRFFNMEDYYVTVDQLADRFLHFSYEGDFDIFESDENIRKAYYNNHDGLSSATMKTITNQCEQAQKQLFTKERTKDGTTTAQKAYRRSRTTADGKIYDELTGREAERTSELEADHVQSRNGAKYNSRYIREERAEKLREFYNSSDNMQMIHGSANASKGDVRVCQDAKGNIEYLNAREMKSRQEKGESVVDITYKATPEQLTEAVVSQWEKESKSSEKIRILKEKGYLDENGKVKDSVKKELLQNYKHSQNKESVTILKNADYKEVARDSGKETLSSMKKIIAGQVIYYVLPPVVFETQQIIRKKNMNLDNFFTEIKKAGKRVVRYVVKKLDKIFTNIAGNAIHKFIKTFFDIIIEMVKATVKKLVRIVKDLVLSLVNCGKILVDKNATAAQKADAVTKTLSVTITTVVMELLFEYLEKQFQLPDFLMEPLQIIVTVVATNIIMLVLNKLDLFDTRYGLLVSNIDRVIDEENALYRLSSQELLTMGQGRLEEAMQIVKQQSEEMISNIVKLDVYQEEAMPYLEQLNKMFHMEIDFNNEWNCFIKSA